MKQFIIVMLLLLPVFTEAQLQKDKLDSLQLALKNAANDTIRMDVSKQLGFYYNSKNHDSTLFYLEQSAFIAKKLKLKLDEAVALQSEASLFSGSYYPKALELLLRTLKINEDPESEKNVWGLPARLTPHKLRLNSLGWTQRNLAQLYGNTGNTDKQILSLLQAIKLAESVQDSQLNMMANMNLGNVYFEKLKKLDSALYFEQRALSLISKSTVRNNDGWIFSAIGNIYKKEGKFDLAKDAFHKGLRLMQENNNLAGIGGICIALSNFYKTINKPDSSLLYANTALETYKSFKDLAGVANAYSSLSSAYDGQNRIDSAFAYLKLATALHDSLNNVERKNLLVYQNVSFDEQMRVRNLEDEKIKTRTKIRTYAMLAGIAVFMLVAFLLYRNNRHRRKANVLLQKQKEEIAEQKEHVEQALVELKSTQSQLIQSEKMASLGELTAGIAHEIQNPLNFVNNFSEVNKELLQELKEEIDKGNYEDVKAIAKDIIDNEEKINHHGKRADGIVKGMLQHRQSSSGKKEPTDINKLADEYLRLSYQGLRVKDNAFNATLKTDFDESIGLIKIIPQDIGRVLLNLINNAFYAVNEKQKAESSKPNADYKPIVSIQTKKINDKVQVIVKDNGNGIPQKIVDKIFQPFFTTKPTGQGTGLGLSLSYDIIKAHGGKIKVETKEREGTTFIIELSIV